MRSSPLPKRETHLWVIRFFTYVEDVVYIGLGLLLAGIVLALLVKGFVSFGKSVSDGSLKNSITSLLDQLLLILLIVELLYTVQVSFRAHTLSPGPFLLIGLISAIRRVLVLTALMGEFHEKDAAVPTSLVLELAVLAALILALAASLLLIKKESAPRGAIPSDQGL
jgi:uncharacterized membrane protein (DUF373 family)